MKKIFIAIVVLGNILLACRKDRTCSCEETKIGVTKTTAALTFSTPLGNVPIVDTTVSAPVNDFFKYEKKIKKSSRSAAKKNCVSYEQPYKEKVVNDVSPLLLVTEQEGTLKVNCSLK